MSTLLLLERLLLALAFGLAAVTKAGDREQFRSALGGFGVPAQPAVVLAVLVPAAEAAVALLLIDATTAQAGAVLAIALLVIFSIAVGLALVRGRAPECRCFGQLTRGRVGPSALVRNTLLALIAAHVAVSGPGRPIGWLAIVALALALIFAHVRRRMSAVG